MPRFLCTMRLAILAVALTFILPRVGWAQPDCNYVGVSSYAGDGTHVLTNAVNGQVGVVWFNEQLDLSSPVSLSMEVYLGNQDATGADGIAFVIQDGGASLMGPSDGALGVPLQSMASSIGIEIDTWDNTGNGYADIAPDHLAIFRDGNNTHNNPNFNLAGPVQASATSGNVEDGQWHDFRVEWDPATTQLEVYFDCALRLSWTGDMVADIFNGQSMVWWGWTGATGGSNNLQRFRIPHLEEENTTCEGTPVTIELEGATAGSVSWTPTTGLSNSGSVSTQADPAATTLYEVSWTDGCGTPQSLETTVEVIPVPAPILPAQSEFCPGDLVSLSVAVPAGGTATWSDGTPGGDWTGNTPGTLTVDVTTQDGCAGSATTDIVALLPMAVNLPQVGPFCPGVTGNIPWPAGTSGWEVDGTATASPWTPGAGNFNLTWTDDGTGCPMDDAYTVGAVVADVPSLPANYDVCSGDGVTLGLNAGAGATFTWSPTTGLDDPVLEQPEASPAVATTYSADVTDICGVLTTLSTTVTVYDVPDPGLPDSVSICPGAQAVLNITPIAGVPAPQWSDGSVGWGWTGTTPGWQTVTVSPLPACSGEDSTFVSAESPTAPVFSVDPLCPGEFTFIPWPAGWTAWQVDGTTADPAGLTVTAPGVYTFVAADAASGCNVAGTIPVPSGALPSMGLPDFLELCEGQSAAVDAGTPEPVYWNDGEVGANRVISAPGNYVAIHSTDCGTVSDSVQVIEVPCGCAVFAPGAFTPDGDMINDAWRPSFECEPDEYTMRIFDRWGGLIWESNDHTEYWTGGVREDGRPLEEKLYYVRDGIYAFQVTYRDPTSVVRKIIRKTGSIMILR